MCRPPRSSRWRPRLPSRMTSSTSFRSAWKRLMARSRKLRCAPLRARGYPSRWPVCNSSCRSKRRDRHRRNDRASQVEENQTRRKYSLSMKGFSFLLIHVHALANQATAQFTTCKPGTAEKVLIHGNDRALAERQGNRRDHHVVLADEAAAAAIALTLGKCTVVTMD